MTKNDLIEMLEEFDGETEIRIQDPMNICGHIPFCGIEVKRDMNGRPIVVLLNSKKLKHEFTG